MVEMIDILREQGFTPRECVWELTLLCNLDCIHCGSSAGHVRENELSADELLRVADELVELGNTHTTLSGGEPTLRREWPQIAKRLTAGGVNVTMISNGYAFTEKHAEQARETGIKLAGFSVDGDEAVHNMIRGRPDAYRRVMKAIDICREQGLPVGVITHIINPNRHQLDDMAKTLLDHGVKVWQLQLGFDFGNLSKHPEMLVEPASLLEIIPKVAQLYQELAGRLRIDAGDDMGYYTEEEKVFRGGPDDGSVDFWVGCAAGIRVIGIEANGNVKGCLSMQSDKFIEGNVRKESLRQIWTKEGNFAYTRNFSVENLGGFCRECRYNEFCRGGCSWKAYLHGKETGKFANRYCLYQVYACEGLCS
jgi:radical SAM protein with 4Fe4S-binding SPASM domain